jgi:hypothetical protein
VVPSLEFGDKENEIATAKADAEWISMSIDEIHARVFGEAALPGCFSETLWRLATRRNAIGAE